MKFSRFTVLALICTLVFSLVAACSNQGQQRPEEKRVLRIATMYGDAYSNERTRTDYTDVFQFVNNHIEIEVVSAIDWNAQRYTRNPNEPYEELDPREEMRKLMEGPNPPDVVFLGLSDLRYFIDENLLVPLDSFITDSNFDLEGIVPAVIEGLRAAGNQVLYALAPQFSSQALIYNRQMFVEAGVPEPTDGMTWTEIFDLAQRISAASGEEKRFGFNFNTYRYSDLLSAMIQYAAPLQLQLFDTDGNLVIDSEPWRNVLQELVALYEQDVIPDQSDFERENNEVSNFMPGPLAYDAFLSGQIAMSLVHHSYLSEVISVNENAASIEGFNGIEWDVVTVPTHLEAPGVGGSLSMHPVMAINANAANQEDAWKLIEFLNGDEWAELKSRSSLEMMSRKDYIRPLPGANYNVAAFYEVTPAPNTFESEVYNIEPNAWQAINIGSMKLHQVLTGDLTVEEALAQWQTEGNAMLKQMRENPDQPPFQINYGETSEAVRVIN